MMVTPGEQIVVRTRQQQSAGVYHFAGGGAIQLGEEMANEQFSSQLNSFRSGGASVTGYTDTESISAHQNQGLLVSVPDSDAKSSKGAPAASPWFAKDPATPNAAGVKSLSGSNNSLAFGLIGGKPTPLFLDSAGKITDKQGDSVGGSVVLTTESGPPVFGQLSVSTIKGNIVETEGTGASGSSVSAESIQAFFKFRDGGVVHARDGMDYTIPGAGAVDSRLLQMAVSPGERVQVQTRQQQEQSKIASQQSGSGGRAINMTVNATDANSFKQSSTQIQRQLGKSMARAARLPTRD
jgi:hypothetical protein